MGRFFESCRGKSLKILMHPRSWCFRMLFGMRLSLREGIELVSLSCHGSLESIARRRRFVDSNGVIVNHGALSCT